MKSFGPLYAGKLNYYHKNFFPVIELGTTQETEERFRKGRCLIFRAPKTIPGYYVGWFYKSHENISDDDAAYLITQAMKARTIPVSTEDIEDWNAEKK